MLQAMFSPNYQEHLTVFTASGNIYHYVQLQLINDTNLQRHW